MPSASNDVDFVRWRDMGLPHAAPPGEFIVQLFIAAPPWVAWSKWCWLIKSRAHRCITDFRDAAVDLHHARMVFGWRRAEIGSDLLTSMLRTA
jgi:hypothetical protein